MPSWKKVITSGSDAILNDLTLSGDISNTSGNFALDVDGDIELNADGSQITMKDGASTRFTFNLDSTPELDVAGAFTIDCNSDMSIDVAGGNLVLANNGTTRFDFGVDSTPEISTVGDLLIDPSTGNTSFDSHITASGDISASGKITSKELLVQAVANNVTPFVIRNVDGEKQLDLSIDSNQHSELGVFKDGTEKIKFNSYWPAIIDNDYYETGGALVLGSDVGQTNSFYGLYVSAGPNSGSAYFAESVTAGGAISSSGKITGDDFEFNLPTDNGRKFKGLTNRGVRIEKASTGGWAMEYGFVGNTERDLGGFGGLGGAGLTRFYIGGHYKTPIISIQSGSANTNGMIIGDNVKETLPSATLHISGGLFLDGGGTAGGHITASGNISSSGTITAASFNSINTSLSFNHITASGNISGSATSTFRIGGKLIAGSKSFVIDRPEGGKLEYGVLEGQQNDVFFRGELKGDNVIYLPQEWEWLVDKDTITVQLTSIGKHQELFVKEIKDNKIFIDINGMCKGKNDIHCYHIIHGTRKDVELIRNYQ